VVRTFSLYALDQEDDEEANFPPSFTVDQEDELCPSFACGGTLTDQAATSFSLYSRNYRSLFAIGPDRANTDSNTNVRFWARNLDCAYDRERRRRQARDRANHVEIKQTEQENQRYDQEGAFWQMLFLLLPYVVSWTRTHCGKSMQFLICT